MGKSKQSLDEASADESASAKALVTSRVTQSFKLRDQSGYLGRIEEFCNVANSRATRCLAVAIEAHAFGGHAPGSATGAGAITVFAGLILAVT
jgi:hypothetical protein